eukprot:364287-Chlamydomonas_euryale.AAC.14
MSHAPAARNFRGVFLSTQAAGATIPSARWSGANPPKLAYAVGRGRGRRGEREEEKWVPCTKLGRLVQQRSSRHAKLCPRWGWCRPLSHAVHNIDEATR